METLAGIGFWELTVLGALALGLLAGGTVVALVLRWARGPADRRTKRKNARGASPSKEG
jgi:hypothetical protein